MPGPRLPRFGPLSPQDGPDVALPTSAPPQGPLAGGDALIKAVTSFFGMPSIPGDVPSGVGAMASLLPITRLLGLVRGGATEASTASNVGDQLLRDHADLGPEFTPVGEEPAAARPTFKDASTPPETLKQRKPRLAGEADAPPFKFPDLPMDTSGASKVDPGTARELSRLMSDLAATDFPRPVSAAMKAAHAKYPRLMGQVESITADPNLAVDGAQTEGSLPGTSRLAIQASKDPEQVTDNLFHELTHAAQQLRLKQGFGPAYDAAQQDFGYLNNPFEQTARKAGSKAVRRLYGQ